MTAMNSLCNDNKIEDQNFREFHQKEDTKLGILHDDSIITNVPIALKNDNENEHLDVKGDVIKPENDLDSETVVKTANNFEMESENEVQHNKNEKHLIVFSVNKPNKSKGNKEKKRKCF